MIHFYRSWNALTTLSSLLLFISYLAYFANASPSHRYPYVLPKCCESNGDASAIGNSTSSERVHIESCDGEGVEVILLPKELFPAMSIDVLGTVEVEMRQVLNGLQCDGGQEYFDILIDFADLKDLPLDNVKKKGFVEVAFSGNSLLTGDGSIYSPRHFCISSRTSNRSSLAIKTCKQTCSSQRPCIPRCCGGHQTVLTSTPAFQNESFRSFCWMPNSENTWIWDPWTSKILHMDNETFFYQTRYVPHFQRDERQLNPLERCKMLYLKKKDKVSLYLLKDGRLRLKKKNRTKVLENFCIDGRDGRAGASSPRDKRSTLEEIVVYVCGNQTWEKTFASVKELRVLPVCNDPAYPPDQPIQLPMRYFRGDTFGTNETIVVRQTTEKNGGSLKCRDWYENIIWDFGRVTKMFFYSDGWFFYSGPRYFPSKTCILRNPAEHRTVSSCSAYHKVLRLRISGVLFKFWSVRKEVWLHDLLGILEYLTSTIFFLAIAVAYILKKEKESVLRCSVVCFSFSMNLYCNLLLASLYYPDSNFLWRVTISSCLKILAMIFNVYSFAWMSVLCFDVWLNIMFLRPKNKSTKRLWGYVALTFIFTSVFSGITVFKRFLHLYSFIDYEDKNKIFPMFDYILWGSYMGIICINFLLFLSTAVKLWIAQHSSDIKNQKKTFLMYFKLFLLVGFRWTVDFIDLLAMDKKSFLPPVALRFLRVLHPIALFFFLVWDEETKRYLETNYPRVKRALDFIGEIGYPVRKCLGLCKKPMHNKPSGNGTAEPPLNSTFLYVHKGRVPGTPK